MEKETLVSNFLASGTLFQNENMDEDSVVHGPDWAAPCHNVSSIVTDREPSRAMMRTEEQDSTVSLGCGQTQALPLWWTRRIMRAR